MKRLLLLLPLLLIAWTPPSGVVNLAWVYTNDLAVTTFRIYGTNNLAYLTTNSPCLATVTGTNFATVTIQPGAFFFICIASNFWGTADPSNVASTPALPRSDGTLTITRGP